VNLRIATVGHVDHGKSTLIGRLLSDTKQTLDERKAKVQSFCEGEGRKFEYAFLLDALEEEQSQGITIDVTEVPWTFADRKYIFVDTPGHREFLKKMVGGASRVDAAILMLDAVEGVRDSLRRQVRVLELLGIRDLIILVNKMDLVDWSEEAWLQRESEVRELFPAHEGTFQVLPAAAWHGANLLESSVEMPWYHGPTLAEALQSIRAKKGLVLGPTRFFVQDVYRTDNKRIYVGRLESGRLQVGDTLTFHPGNQSSRIRTIEVFGEERTAGVAGESLGLTLEDSLFLDRGALGFSSMAPPCEASSAIVDLFWLADQPIHVGQRLVVKTGTRQCAVRVAEIIKEIDGDTFVEHEGAGEIKLFGRVRFAFDRPLAFDRFSDCEPTGRFVVCVDGQIHGGGRWVEPTQEPSAKDEGRVLWFTGFSGAGKTTLALALEKKCRDQGRKVIVLDGDVLRQGLCRDLGFSPEDRSENLRRAAEVAKLFADAGFLVITAFISPLEQHRHTAREIIGENRFSEVHVDAPMATCERRDVKGLYAKARRGEILDFTGVSAHFEAPRAPALHLSTAEYSVESSLLQLENFLNKGSL
jgi:bifunctional enzyme CysN/CysC